MRSLYIFFACLLSYASRAEVIVIGKELPYSSVGKSVSYLKDKTANLSLEEVIAANRQGRFIKGKDEILNFGNSQAAYWVRIDYIRKDDDKAFLVVDASNIESIDLYTEDLPGTFKRIHTGSLAPPHPDVTTANNYTFTLPPQVQLGRQQTAYLRVKTNNILLVPIKIAETERLLAGLNATERFEAIYIGILLALFFFNLSVFIKSRDLTYLYYSLYTITLFIYVIFYIRGYGYLLGDSFRQFVNLHPHFFLGLGTLAGIAFANNFLDLKKYLPSSLKAIKAMEIAWIVVIAMSLLGFKAISANASQLLSAVTTLSIWILGILVYAKGNKTALYYIVAWAFVCLTTLWLVLSLEGLFPISEFSMHITPLGFILELLLLSQALGDRLKEMKKERVREQVEKLKAQEENLYLVNSQNERLERVVESRTRALKKIVQSLEAANADKTRIFSIIAHDLRSPFNSLISLLSLNDMDLLNFDDVKMLLNDSRKNIDNIHNTLNNLLYWAQSQMKGITTAPSRFNMRILVDDLMMVYQPLIVKKNIRWDFVVNDDQDVFADLNQISLVMRNLIDNAIKFTPHNCFIHIRIWGNSGFIFVDVCNPVAGSLNLDQLTAKEKSEPSYGTANERGVGLGLHLCRDFVEKNKGLLKVSKENECVVLRFNLPKFVDESSPEKEAELMVEA